MKPILCNTTVVQNILAGRQTQDRRPIKFKKGLGEFVDTDDAWQWAVHNSTGPKYQVGDVLYVRETFKGAWKPLNTPGWYVYIITYKADGAKVRYRETHLDTVDNWPDKWKPSIHMPKKFARTFLKVTGVRVELIQDISDNDIEAEGTDFETEHGSLCFSIQDESCYENNLVDGSAVRTIFKKLWDSLYPGSWDRNDWVFVYDFELCERQV
jgi:hypothetical protein